MIFLINDTIKSDLQTEKAGGTLFGLGSGNSATPFFSCYN